MVRALFLLREIQREKGSRYQAGEDREEFEGLLASCRDQRKGSYDIVVAYSGGKDSTFILDLLKSVYKLHILALTFDHGFVPPMRLKICAG